MPSYKTVAIDSPQVLRCVLFMIETPGMLLFSLRQFLFTHPEWPIWRGWRLMPARFSIFGTIAKPTGLSIALQLDRSIYDKNTPSAKGVSKCVARPCFLTGICAQAKRHFLGLPLTGLWLTRWKASETLVYSGQRHIWDHRWRYEWSSYRNSTPPVLISYEHHPMFPENWP